jgi:uncharacterized membrane protein YdbT with pleckstrin-like domain
LTTEKPVQQSVYKDIIWVGKPYITPAAVTRTIIVFALAVLLVLFEFYVGVAQLQLWLFPLYLWTIVIFIFIWIISLFGLLVLRASHTYTLRRDALEVRRGILNLQSFVVTPQGFGDLTVCQPVVGRIFSYGDILVHSQGERQTKLRLVHSPFKVADEIREIMGKPIVRVENHV